MKKLRIRESKLKAFMEKRGYRDIYEMKDMLLVDGYEPEIVKDGTTKEKLACVWWWVRKVLSFIVSAVYIPLYYALHLVFAAISIVRGIVLFLMLEPERAAKCFIWPFNPKRQ